MIPSHRLDRIHRTTADKNGQPPEQFLFVFIQQIITPGNGIPQGLLARRQIARAAGQKFQTVLQAGEHGARRQ